MKANALLNREWGKHVKRFEKKHTNKKRRAQDRRVIAENN